VASFAAFSLIIIEKGSEVSTYFRKRMENLTLACLPNHQVGSDEFLCHTISTVGWEGIHEIIGKVSDKLVAFHVDSLVIRGSPSISPVYRVQFLVSRDYRPKPWSQSERFDYGITLVAYAPRKVAEGVIYSTYRPGYEW